MRCGSEIATRLALFDERLCGPGRRFPQPGALGLEPALELRSVRDEEPFEERAAVQVRGLEPLASVDGALQGRDIRPHLPKVETYVLIAAIDQNSRAESGAEHAECLTQRCARVLLVELRPEERQQAVAAMEATRCRSGKVGEEGETTRLPEEGRRLAPVGTGEAQSPEQTKLDHSGPLWQARHRREAHAAARAVTVGVTLASQ